MRISNVTILLSLLVSLLSVVPHIRAYFATPEGHFFIGVNTVTNLADIQGVYFPAMQKFSEGEILYMNPYDSFQAPYFVFPLYVVLGKIVGLTNLPVEFVFHLAAFIIGFFFLLFIFNFLKLYFDDFKRRLLAFGLAVFGGLFLFAVPEGTGFFSLTIPHFIVAQFTLFGCFYYLILISKSGKVRFGQLTLFFMASLVLSAIHPWMVVPLVISFFLWRLILKVKKERVGFLLLLSLVLIGTSLPFLIYYQQNIPWVSYPLPSSMFSVLLLYGPFLAVGLIGFVIKIRNKKTDAWLFLLIWFFVEMVFAHLPLPFQRRFFEGIYLPLAIFAVVGIDGLIDVFNLRKSINIVYSNAFVYLSLGVIATYVGLIVQIPGDFIYRRVEEKQAVKFFDEYSRPNDKVLSLPFTGVFIASSANVQIFIGQAIQTPNFERKNKIVKAYYGGELNDEDRESLIQSENVCFVYVGPEEEKINRIDFEKEDYLVKFYSNNLVEIYKTKWCS